MKYIHQNTTAYYAGRLTAVLYNCYTKRLDLPNLLSCMVNFEHLPTVFGKYYTLLKGNKNSHNYVINYENFINKIDNLQSKGGYSDFMIGYSEVIKKIKL